jgi:O-acetyl-ADP-ribose deacetylase (regulator of RNase III)
VSITLHQGSILDSTADCIVNPANSFLMHGGGLARVIADAARKTPLVFNEADFDRVTAERDRWNAEQASHPNVATGDAAWSSPGFLPFKGIVHAVGPIYKDGKLFERQLLASAHSRAIAVAREHGCTSIAFPAISTGIFGYPIAEAAEVAVRQCAWHSFPIEFWLFSDEDYAAYEIALGDVPVIR